MCDQTTYNTVFDNAKQAAERGAPFMQVYKETDPLHEALLKGYAAGLSKEQYQSLLDELDGLEMSVAMGQDTPEGDLRMKEIDALMKAAPWEIDMDSCKVVPLGEYSGQLSPAV